MNEALRMAVRRAKAAGPQAYLREREGPPSPPPAPPELLPAVTVTTETRLPWQERSPNAPNCPSIGAIKHLVCARFNLKPVAMVTARRSRDIAWPRQIAMYLAATMTPNSLPQIGRQFGDRDHTTCMHARNKIAAKRKTDPDLDAMLSRLEMELLSC